MAASKVPSGVNVPMWTSYSTAVLRSSTAGSWFSSVQSNAEWSTTRDGPCTPSGCHGLRGSGRVGPPSMAKR